jgi:hypothetical protein
MNFTVIIQISFPLAFFLINIVFTQRVYRGRNLELWMILSLLFPVMIFYFVRPPLQAQALNWSMLLFYYFGFLLLIKRNYRKINHFLIEKDMVSKKFKDKEFTYVHWNSMDPSSTSWWDEELAGKPSWFDYLLTFFLFTVPFLLSVIFYRLTTNVS